MVLEIAEIKVAPANEAEFLRNAMAGISIFTRAKGCKGAQIRSSSEAPGEYRLLVRWETLENHIVDFRESEGLKEWRGLVGHCFDGVPVIKNWTVAVEGFGLDI